MTTYGHTVPRLNMTYDDFCPKESSLNYTYNCLTFIPILVNMLACVTQTHYNENLFNLKPSVPYTSISVPTKKTFF